jgi:catechol 2,3-dioxygenase-like lactoylglutathione lyase family enzyme
MDMQAPDRAEAPMALNHVVLNVRDIDESHRFWTEIIASATSARRSHAPTGRSRPICGSTVATTAADA